MIIFRLRSWKETRFCWTCSIVIISDQPKLSGPWPHCVEFPSKRVSYNYYDHHTDFDWEAHASVSRTLDRLIELLPQLKKSQILQAAFILDRLRIKSDSTLILSHTVDAWEAWENNLAKVYHQLTPRDFYAIIELTLRNDRMSEKFCEIYADVVAMHIKLYNPSQLTLLFDLLVKNNLG